MPDRSCGRKGPQASSEHRYDDRQGWGNAYAYGRPGTSSCGCCHSVQGCRTIGVYWNGTLIRQISLNYATTAYRQVISTADFGAPRSGTLVIKR